ncbi:MAG: septum formation protein Maf [Chloroflexi bacterium]|nr:septum formation protein Maf [Chloroflexota bacterium]
MALPALILASSSPRRRQLLALLGWPFDILTVEIDERPIAGERPDDYVQRLAETKAHTAGPRVPLGSLVLAADTTVANGKVILGKPQDATEAAVMLRQLRGRNHQVYTALAIYEPQTGQLEKDLCVSQVPMRSYSDAEMEAYIASGDPLDKAGAYAIQHLQFQPVVNFSGCFASVMGLPLCHLVRTRSKFGNEIRFNDVPRACQAELHYDCPISAAVLRGENLG